MRYHGRIHSRLEDNWNRVISIFSIVQNLYKVTENSDYRKRFKKSDYRDQQDFFSNFQTSCDIREESVIVEMLMVWVAITIESAINHVVAEQIRDNEILQIIYECSEDETVGVNFSENTSVGKIINGINNFFDNKKIKSRFPSLNPNSEASKKIVVLNMSEEQLICSENELIEIIKIVDELAYFRNSIVHDKPIGERTLYNEDGEFLDVAIDNFSKHKTPLNSPLIYEDLNEFFMDCDKVVKFITKNIDSDFHFIKFQSLLN